MKNEENEFMSKNALLIDKAFDVIKAAILHDKEPVWFSKWSLIDEKLDVLMQCINARKEYEQKFLGFKK
jgi:hypothetical protein